MTSENVLNIFKEITTVPRESGHEEKIIAWLQTWAADRKLQCKTDAAGNVLIVKEAAPGYEDRPVIVLQNHSDMVCEKNSGVEHDFTKDPIRYIIKDGWMIAPDTTLGADCGIGMAAALALIDSGEPMGRVECLFTVSEETGLDGAFALEADFFTGKVLINLDSEDEGELFIGCAGGLDTTARFDYGTEPVKAGSVQLRLRIFNAVGGHSGDDIDKGRANAVQLLARYLYSELESGFQLVSIDGGNKRNAIAREAEAVIAVDSAQYEGLRNRFELFADEVKAEFSTADPALSFSVELLDAQAKTAIESDCVTRLITSLFAVAHGVLAMSMDIKGLVETSTNLASVKMNEPGVIRVGTSQRSSITSARRMAGMKVEACFRLGGARVSHESEYPGWKPNTKSHLLDVSVASYEKLFNVRPVVRAIHAGLECGLFLDKYPDLDMISFGPTLRGVHAPGERLDLASLDKFVLLLEDIVKNYE